MFHLKARLATLALAAIALSPGVASAQQRPAASPLDALDSVAAGVVEKVSAAVVLIEVERAASAPRRLTPRESEGLGLGDQYDPRYFTRPTDPCTGVVIGPGLVATSIWNLAGTGAVTVIAPDGTHLPARRLGRDENLDVALLAVDAPGLTPLPLAPEGPVVGRFLLLVSRTAEDGPSVTEGIVSGLGRHRGDSFAHSARTSYHNVGGALVDLEGRLVGLSVRHTDRARQGQSSGVGFGAPALAVQVQLAGLARGDVVARRPAPFLGVQCDAEAVLEVGVRVIRAVEGTEALKAGVLPGDVIKIFNSVELRNFYHLREEIEKLSIGDEIVITIKRGDQELDLRVRLGVRPVEDE